ncbi:GNAT family N-acetyltransferase [uncultured Nocardioides sp.]|uniref:GNAT family N-acetyltransferase n=1 Tax=uncultured Nocardioides sp. TaxID=198441 RepID=UPI00260BC3E3|nr:GNAT family N-acetyltransferase [uncultured Nocardioides sp.]
MGAPAIVIRPMRLDDVAEVERISGDSFSDLERRLPVPTGAAATGRDPARSAQWRRRTEHLLATDPGGCWVAEDPADAGGGVVGFAVSFTRELMWVLASYGVRPGLQGRGTGRVLLEAALHHGRGCLRGMLASSPDPAAVRRYRLAGFDLHPAMLMTGAVDRAALPVLGRIREGTLGDRDLMDSVDRRARGAAHGPDHDVLHATTARLLVVDRPAGQGYAYLRGSGEPALLAATTVAVARDLAWEALASAPAGEPGTRIGHLTAANQWAIDVGLAAGLALHQRGYLALRRCRPPTPYLHHGSLL